jgi:hypothetical protein
MHLNSEGFGYRFSPNHRRDKRVGRVRVPDLAALTHEIGVSCRQSSTTKEAESYCSCGGSDLRRRNIKTQARGHACHETGADVVVLVDGRRVGIQVTDLDTGCSPGAARAVEARARRRKRGRHLWHVGPGSTQ